MREGIVLQQYPISKIKLNHRFRTDLGDIPSLAASIEEVGLLHPIVLDTEDTLIAGHRRIEAFKLLGRKSIPIYRVDLDEIWKGEIHENTARKNFTFTEMMEMAERLEPKVKKQAGERKRSGKPQGKLPYGRTRQLVANYFGLGGRTYEKAKKIQHADLPAEVKQELIEKIDRKKLSIDKAYNDVKRLVRRKELLSKTEQQLPTSVKLLQSDFRLVDNNIIPSNSIDLIITDPPYTEESLPIYTDLYKFADRVLKEGGSLLCYAGQYALDTILSLNTTALQYWWLLVVQHSGFGTHAVHKQKIIPKYKPLLWFIKGKRAKQLEYVLDLVNSEMPDKATHEWAQSTIEAEYYIRYLTEPGDTVLDPMMGAGTFGLAAVRQKRKFIGIDIEKINVEMAKRVLNSQ